MRLSLVLLTFFTACFLTEAACQQSVQSNTKSANIVRSTFDSLELVKRPQGIGEVVPNKHKLYKIRVCGQKRFDELETLILSALRAGHKNILVTINKGVYFFEEEHLKLERLDYPDADIRIDGKDVTVVPKGWSLRNNDNVPCDVSGESCFVDIKNKKNVSSWSDLMFTDGLIEVVDASTKRCRLKCSALGDLYVPEGNMAYLDLTRWCRCYQYKILKIEDGYIDFYVHDLEKDNIFGTKQYNVNYDYVVGKTYPRFRICNSFGNESVSVIDHKIKLSNYIKYVHLGNSGNFLTLNKVDFRYFSIRGITFLGNKQTDALIKLNTAMCSCIEINNCCFIGQKAEVLTEVYSKNLFFHDNLVSDNYVWGIDSNPSSWNTTIENNTFENNGIGLSYSRCVSCMGDNYYIANNTFKNFGYCAISVGLWYGSEMKLPAKGIVEYNDIGYDHHYFAEAWKHTIMDGGAIYVWTQNERSIIRYNYIHDYTVMSHNRGIFFDYGDHHVAVYGNIIVNTPSMHSIDSRRVESTERNRKKSSFSVNNNINNFIAYNIIDGTINFVGRENKNNGCIKGKNVVLVKDEKNKGLLIDHNAEEKNLMIKERDEDVIMLGYDNKGIVVNDRDIERIKDLPILDKIEKWVKCVEQ